MGSVRPGTTPEVLTPTCLSSHSAQPRVPGLFSAVIGLSTGGKKKARCRPPVVSAALPSLLSAAVP